MTEHRKPEQPVIDRIDELVNEQLATGPRKPTGLPQCPHSTCYREWHGEPKPGCPGSHQPFDADYRCEELELPQFPREFSPLPSIEPLRRAYLAIVAVNERLMRMGLWSA